MSGRSAHARKKFTEGQKPGAPSTKSTKSSRARAASTAPGEHGHYDEPVSPGFGSYHDYHSANRLPATSGARSSGSWGTPSEADVERTNEHASKTGFRNLIDKRSEDVRKGLAKTFTFRKKEKEDDVHVDHKRRSSIESRPESQATMRYGESDKFVIHDDYPASPPIPTQYQNPGGFRQHHQAHQQYQQHQQPGYPSRPPDAHELGPSPTSRLPPAPQKQGPPMKRWSGGGRSVSRWNKLNRDPELLDPNGDVLVFLSPRDPDQTQDYGQLTMPLPLPPSSSRPPASFRISSHVIESTQSRYLITQMREGLREDDDTTPRAHPMQAPSSNNMGHPTPPLSPDGDGDSDGDISFEMYFPPPPGLSHAEQVRHQLTTRNVFALLYRASLVGFSLHQALTDLHARLDRYYSPGENDAVGQIVNYLSARGITDVRGDAESAVGLLAWTEKPGVRWAQGWREAFLHCAGMFGQGLERCADWRFVAPLTKALLERSWLEMRLRVQTAEERLADFGLGEMWPEFGQSAAAAGAKPDGSPANGGVGSARGTAERLQKMLLGHYTRAYGSWPPPPIRDRPSRKASGAGGSGSSSEEEEMWLTRSVVMSLQRDFGALYDYLVDRDVSWDVSEARAGRKWMMVSADESQGFEADTADMPMTDILIEFDNKLRLPHIPHPHPLLPQSIPPMQAPAQTGGGGMFKSSSQPSAPPKNHGRERRVALAYTESTNLDALGSTFAHSSLVDAYVRFEKTDRVSEVDPATARRGRWTLLYAVLQTLAAVSVDAPGVRYHDGVAYHLSARVKRPAWNKAAELFGDAAHDMSHCWIAPGLWAEAAAAEVQAAELATSRMDDYGSGGVGLSELDDGAIDDETAAWDEESLPALPQSPPQLSASVSETGSSVRTASTHSGVYSHNLRRQAAMGASPTLPASPPAMETMMMTPLPPLPAGAQINRRRVGAGPGGARDRSQNRDRDFMAEYHNSAPRSPLPIPPTRRAAPGDPRSYQAIDDVTEASAGYRHLQQQQLHHHRGPRVVSKPTADDDEYRDDMKMLRRRMESPIIRDFDGEA